MTTSEKKIAFKIEFSRMLNLLADQIYQSPLALLRENTQNAFDAIRMRGVLDHEFAPLVEVTVNDEAIVVSDNGIGMTSQEIETNFWYAGMSGKNTVEARAAGVVGTFGIGAMSNFGVADFLSVESESAVTGERTLSSVHKSNLSTERESISVVPTAHTGSPGTTVTARLAPAVRVSVREARDYLGQFVQFVDIPVLLNGERLSGASHRTILPSDRYAWSEKRQDVSLGDIASGDLEVLGMASGELRVVVENVESENGLGRLGTMVLLQGRNSIRTLRSGFGLATVGMRSIYSWGGVADLPFLKPTAGREALDDTSNQLLQKIISTLDRQVSQLAARHVESFSNDNFLQWVAATKNFHLCGHLEVTPRPSGQSEFLKDVIERGRVQYYSGRDEAVIGTYASEEQPLIVLSRRSPRRDCELGYLTSQGVNEVDITPRVEHEIPTASQTFAQTALALRVARVLEEDYFLAANIRFGDISGGLPLLVTDSGIPVTIFLDPWSTSIAPLLAIYSNDFLAFAPFVKDFVRTGIFPRISRIVPSSTREGSEAFLRHLRANREWFEYELEDKADLEEVFEELRAGRLTVAEATMRLVETGRSVVEVSSAGTAPLSSVVREVSDEPEGEIIPNPFDPRPGIDRRESETSALILTSDEAINGYTCFLSLSERVQREKGDFFLQPHSTEIVWGGQKVIFIFQHHSGRFGLYYDILCPGLVGAASGGCQGVTTTILTKGRTFIPVPDEIADDFLPKEGERKRLEVRCDILYLEEWEASES